MVFITIREEWERHDERKNKEEEDRTWRGRMDYPENSEMLQLRVRAGYLKKTRHGNARSINVEKSAKHQSEGRIKKKNSRC